LATSLARRDDAPDNHGKTAAQRRATSQPMSHTEHASAEPCQLKFLLSLLADRDSSCHRRRGVQFAADHPQISNIANAPT
jgi:hypothetical protein